MTPLRIIAFFFLLTSPLSAQTSSSTINIGEQDIEEFIDSIGAAMNLNGSILFRNSNSIYIHKNFGFATAEKSQLIDHKSYFNSGSISKTICSYALFSLIEEGKIKFSDSISNYLTELPDWSIHITVEELMFYNSGLPARKVRTDYTDENFWQELNALEELNTKENRYSNYSNFLQAKLVEAITETSLKDYVQKTFFDTLNMRGSRYTKYPTSETELKLTRSFSDQLGDDILHNPRVLNFDLCYAPVYMAMPDLNLWLNFIVDNYDPASKLHGIFYQEIKEGEYGPLGQVIMENGIIQSYEFAGQSYNSLVRGYFDIENSVSFILATNKYERDQLLEFKEQIYSKLASLKK